MYRGLIRSKLDYGYIVYGSARQSVLRLTGSNPPSGLAYTIALGAYHTSPAQSFYMEAHEPPLASRCLKRASDYVLKLKSLPENPVYNCIFEAESVKLFEDSDRIFHLSASACYFTWANPELTLN